MLMMVPRGLVGVGFVPAWRGAGAMCVCVVGEVGRVPGPASVAGNHRQADIDVVVNFIKNYFITLEENFYRAGTEDVPSR